MFHQFDDCMLKLHQPKALCVIGLRLFKCGHISHITPVYSITSCVAPATHVAIYEPHSHFPSLLLPKITLEVWIVSFLQYFVFIVGATQINGIAVSRQLSLLPFFLSFAFGNWSPGCVMLLWPSNSLLFWVEMEDNALACHLYADWSLFADSFCSFVTCSQSSVV